ACSMTWVVPFREGMRSWSKRRGGTRLLPRDSMRHRHWAGRDRDLDHVGDVGILEAVVNHADRLLLGSAGVGRFLARGLVGSETGVLIDLGARVPQREL